MKSLPHDPAAFQARVFDAMCADIFDLGAGKTRQFDRVNALLETRKQTKKEGE